MTRILSEGPKITIIFQSAEGLEAGKTKIHYNGVDVGTVTAIRLVGRSPARDRHRADGAPRPKDFLVEDTQFWVVRPRISGANVTGLGTLISGAYIGMEIGSSTEPKRDFVALETPPVVTGDVAGPLLRAEDPRPGFAGHRHADLLPAPAGRPGRVVRARQGRQVLDRQGIRAGALRPVRHPEHALLAGERDRRVALRQRPQRADPVGAVDPDRRHRVRDARERSGPAAGRGEHRLHPVQRPGRGLQAGRPQSADLPAHLQGLGPRARARRAGRVPRHSDRRGRGRSRANRSQDLRVLGAGDYPPGPAETRGQGRRAGRPARISNGCAGS